MYLVLILISSIIPLSLFAAAGDFVSLVTIPTLQLDSGTTLVEYVNAVFTLIISLAVMLAVLRIVTGGFKYMTSEAIGSKGDARETIQGAVFGLILLLGSWLIFYTINPEILDLSSLQFSNLQSSGAASTSLAVLQTDKAAMDARAQAFGDPSGFIPYSSSRGGSCASGIQKIVRVDSMPSYEKRQHEAACRSDSSRMVEEYSVAVCTRKGGDGTMQGVGINRCANPNQRTNVTKGQIYRTYGNPQATFGKQGSCGVGDSPRVTTETYLRCYKPTQN